MQLAQVDGGLRACSMLPAQNSVISMLVKVKTPW